MKFRGFGLKRRFFSRSKNISFHISVASAENNDSNHNNYFLEHYQIFLCFLFFFEVELALEKWDEQSELSADVEDNYVSLCFSDFCEVVIVDFTHEFNVGFPKVFA